MGAVWVGENGGVSQGVVFDEYTLKGGGLGEGGLCISAKGTCNIIKL